MAIINGTKFGDFLIGTSGSDTMNGFGGDDDVLGLAGDDLLDGGGGNDGILGFAGNDVIFGGIGDDFLRGGSGDDVIDGGAGYDRVSFAVGGFDTLDLPLTGVTISLLLQGIPQNTGHGWDTLINIEHLSGTGFDDTLIGDDHGNWLWTSQNAQGLGGNDTILGLGGDDLISVVRGNHLVDGGLGVDTLEFDEGFDTRAGAAVSLLLQGAPQDTRQGIITLSGFENLSGTSFNDELIGDGANNVLAGSAGPDTLVGLGGDDLLLGDGVIQAERSQFTGDGAITIFPDVEELWWYNFVPGGNDLLDGGAGNDQLVGANGDDRLDGGGDNDVLEGGRGHDLLIGGPGDDLLFGGPNRDTYEFGPGSGHDTIVEYDADDEVISIIGVAGVGDFSDLTLTRSGFDTIVSWSGGAASITLQDVKPNELSAANFDFGVVTLAAWHAFDEHVRFESHSNRLDSYDLI